MSALLFIVIGAIVMTGMAESGALSPPIAAVVFAVFLVVVGVLGIVEEVLEYRERKRANDDDFLSEVMAAHKCAREAREATERA